MARRRWTLNLEDGVHVVELEHGFWSGRRKIKLDGAVVLESPPRALDDGGSHHELVVGRHDIEVHIRTNGVWFQYRCLLDGDDIPPDLPPEGGARLPAAGTGPIAVSTTVEPSRPATDVKRRDHFISFEGWFRGER